MALTLKASKNKAIQDFKTVTEAELANPTNQAKVLIKGQIWKRGSRVTDEFKSRFITVTLHSLSYAVDEVKPAIQNVEMDQIVGMSTITALGSDKSNWPKGADTGDDAVEDEDSKKLDDPENEGARNVVFWRYEDDLQEEKRAAFSYPLTKHGFAIFTAPAGIYRGRVFAFKTASESQREKWVETVCRVVSTRLERPVQPATALHIARKRVHWYYMGDRSQIFVAALISFNFVLNIAQAQTDPNDEEANVVYESIDMVFTIIFTFELLINMFATLFWPFVMDAWNWFDLLVVGVSLVSLLVADLPGATVMRLLRCFRVFRLFKRIKSLKKIVLALTKSIVPMCNAFCIVCLVTAIYSIVATTFYGEVVPENFSSFFVSFYTLFEAITGAWAVPCRELMANQQSNLESIFVALFYVSFMLIVSLVLINVVITVLLDEFGKASAEAAQADAKPELVDEGEGEVEGPKPCPFERMAKHFSKSTDLKDFEGNVASIWTEVIKFGQIDKFESGSLEEKQRIHCLRVAFKSWKFRPDMKFWTCTLDQFRLGVKCLEWFIPPLVLTKAHCAEFVTPFVNPDGTLGRTGFQGLMTSVLRKYQMREIAKGMNAKNWGQVSLKGIMMGSMGLVREDMVLERLGRNNNRWLNPNRFKKRGSNKEEPPVDIVDKMMDALSQQVQSMDRRLNRLRVVGNVDNGTEHATEDGNSGGAGGGGGG